MFNAQVREELEYYVYALEDPRCDDRVGRIFYIGKGKGDRVFEHMNTGVHEESKMSSKSELIAEIKSETGKDPSYSIIQHGLKEKEAFRLEAQLISVFDGLLTNLAGGHRGVDYWLSGEEIKNRYDNPISLEEIQRPILFVSLNGEPSYPEIADDEEMLRARTLGDWNISGEKAESIKYVYGCYAGLVRCAYAVDPAHIQTIEPSARGAHRRTRWLDGKRDADVEKNVLNRTVVDEHRKILSVMPSGAGRRFVV